MKPDFLPKIPYTFIENFYLSCLHPHWHIHHKQPYTMMTFLKISWEKWILVYCIKFYTFLLRLFIYLYICFIKYVAFFMCVCVYVHVCTHMCVYHITHLEEKAHWRWEDILWSYILSTIRVQVTELRLSDTVTRTFARQAILPAQTCYF